MYLNELTREIWLWCINRNIWLSCFYIPGRLNKTADKLSRKLTNDMEWSLSAEIFQKIQNTYGQFDIDLFASPKNYKVARFASFIPDEAAVCINAFSLTWADYFSYIFCPFSMMGPVLQKLCTDGAEAVIIAPIFSIQPWFPLLLKMICQTSHVLPPPNQILHMGKETNKHPLSKMRLGVFRVSGNSSSCQEYRKQLPPFLSHLGETLLKNSIGRISKSGVSFVIEEKLINFSHM